MPNAEEELDFFSKQTWEKTDEEIKTEEKKKEEKTKSENDDRVEDSAPLILNMEDDWRDMSYLKAMYISEEIVRELEKEKLFMPLGSRVPFEQKTSSEGAQPRFLEEDGIYVGRKPFVTRKNRNLMENRLIKFADKVEKN